MAARIFSISGRSNGFVKLHASNKEGSIGAELYSNKRKLCELCFCYVVKL